MHQLRGTLEGRRIQLLVQVVLITSDVRSEHNITVLVTVYIRNSGRHSGGAPQLGWTLSKMASQFTSTRKPMK